MRVVDMDRDDATCMICGCSAVYSPSWESKGTGETICQRCLAEAVVNAGNVNRDVASPIAVKIGKRMYAWHGPHITFIFTPTEYRDLTTVP